jgi:hypothetical protein
MAGGIVLRTDPLPAPTPIVPVVSPPRSPRVNDLDAHVERTGVGTTPTISWSAPALGSPDRYAVTLVRLFVGVAGQTVAESVANLRTRSRAVTIPPGILQAGERYYALVTAAVGSPVPYEALRGRGIRTGYGYATAITAAFEP